VSVAPIADILDTPDRRGYARGDNEHTAPAILLSSNAKRSRHGGTPAAVGSHHR
jgi:hypothetical protein